MEESKLASWSLQIEYYSTEENGGWMLIWNFSGEKEKFTLDSRMRQKMGGSCRNIFTTFWEDNNNNSYIDHNVKTNAQYWQYGLTDKPMHAESRVSTGNSRSGSLLLLLLSGVDR